MVDDNYTFMLLVLDREMHLKCLAAGLSMVTSAASNKRVKSATVTSTGSIFRLRGLTKLISVLNLQLQIDLRF